MQLAKHCSGGQFTYTMFILAVELHKIGSGINCANGRASLSFSEEAAKKLRVVLQCIFGRDFLSPRTTIVLGMKIIPAPACLVALIWHSCYRA